MNEILNKAVQGGWSRTNTYSQAVIDPLFWQALGKACGWNGDFWRANIDGSSEWYLKAMSFHEINLTEGWDKATAYLESLTN